MMVLGLFEISGWLLLLLGILLLTYIIVKYMEEDVFEAQGVTGPYRYPLIGTLRLAMFKKGIRDYILDVYFKYGKLYRTALFGKTSLWVSDEEMLREILVKNFGSFTNTRQVGMLDSISSKMLTVLKDEQWRRVRTLLTPTFTTGKIKKMVCSIGDCADLLVQNLEEYCQKNESFNVKDLCGAYTLDVIARTGFGLQIDSQKDKDNQFVRMIKKAMDFRLTSIPVLVALMCPKLAPLMTKLGFSFISKDFMNFFVGVLEQTIQRRNEGEVSQSDFLQLMIDAHTDDINHEVVEAEAREMGAEYDHTKVDLTKGLSRDEMMAQGLLFFLAGYDTTASGFTMLLYNLARNPEAQEKLYEEIISELGEEGEITYGNVGRLTYMEMCLEESLRLYAPAVIIDRVASQDVIIKGILIPKGSIINVPVQGIHRDPDIYPDPEEFKPERFTPEQKAKRSPYHWMPFGYGPRNCIGMRLAILEIKIATAQVLRRFRLVTCEETEYPLVFEKSGFLNPKTGCVLKVEQRT